MYCRNCGKEIADQAVVCINCGVAVSKQINPAIQIPNYLVQSILVTILCCLPFGIPAIVYSAQVNGKLQAGDIQGATEASRKAKMWGWISFGTGLVIGILYAIMIAVGVNLQK
jgi:hypothetical protein